METNQVQLTEFEMWAAAFAARVGLQKSTAMFALGGLVSSIDRSLLTPDEITRFTVAVLNGIELPTEDFIAFMRLTKEAAARGEDGTRAGEVSAQAYLDAAIGEAR